MILCSDDYGLSEDVDAAILDLCKSSKLTSVSCLAALDRCRPETLAKLRAHEEHLDIGLHLFLARERELDPRIWTTQGRPAQPSFTTLLWASLAGRVTPREMAREIGRQYDLFVTKSGRTPDYLDGHLHVHQFPRVRDAVINFILGLPADQRPYVRNTSMSARLLRQRGLPGNKALLIGLFGERMKVRLWRAGIETNDGFAGIYDFKKSASFPVYLKRFVNCLAGYRDGILVVHPGRSGEWRRNEFNALTEMRFEPGILNRLHRPKSGCTG